MVAVVAAIALGVAVGLVLILVIFYILVLRRGRRLGTRGIIQRSRLRCPKCGREFDFDYFPGGSFTALRLGRSRYMSCPLCHQWSAFNLHDTMIARTPPAEDSGDIGDPPLTPG